MIITFILTFSSLRIFVWDSSVGEESTGLDSWVRKIRWRRDRLSIPVFLSFPCGSAGKESAHNAGELGSLPGQDSWHESTMQLALREELLLWILE